MIHSSSPLPWLRSAGSRIEIYLPMEVQYFPGTDNCRKVTTVLYDDEDVKTGADLKKNW